MTKPVGNVPQPQPTDTTSSIVRTDYIQGITAQGERVSMPVQVIDHMRLGEVGEAI